MKNITDNKQSDYVIIVKNGINIEEGIQERQDACILINQFYNENIWITINEDILEIVKEMRKSGIMDKYGVIIKETPNDPVLQNRIFKFNEKYLFGEKIKDNKKLKIYLLSKFIVNEVIV